MIPQKTINEILDRVQIEDVISDFVSLKRRGANYVACCPFHDEKTPSFSVSPSKGLYKCFGCGEAGDAVHFVIKHEGMSYPDAIRYLAKKYNITIEEQQLTPAEIAAKQHSEALYLTMDFAQKHFVENLKTQEGSVLAMAYYRSRGLTDATIAKFGLGWSMTGYTDLSTAAQSAGFKPEYLEDCGLAYRRDNGSLTDSFVERITFPVYSVSGRVIAFSCRTLRKDDERAKYKNSKETEIFIKSKNAFGLFQAKNAIAKENCAILVEGNIDVIQMHQSGVENVVASLGTSLTPEQVKLIRKFTTNITLMYDGDKAGVKAAIRAIALILAEGMDISIVLLPDGQDPDDFAKTHSREEILQFIKDNKMDFVEFMYENSISKEDFNDLNAYNTMVQSISDTIALIPEGIKRSVFIQKLSSLTAIDSPTLSNRVKKSSEAAALRKQTPVGQPASTERATIRPSTDLDQFEKELLEYLLLYGCEVMNFPNSSPYYSKEATTVADFIDMNLCTVELTFTNELYRAIYDEYFALYEQGLDAAQILTRFCSHPDQRITSVVADLVFEKYSLTSERFKSSMPDTNFILVTKLPVALKQYQKAVLSKTIDDLTASVGKGGNDKEILRKIVYYNQKRASISKELGRI